MDHLERRGIPRRTSRKLTDDQVNLAARRYLHGDTLADIAARLHVSPTSLTRELRLASIPIRRRGRRTSG
jgi:DNA-binding transcriptional regulator LsrR (DeoR family)